MELPNILILVIVALTCFVIVNCAVIAHMYFRLKRRKPCDINGIAQLDQHHVRANILKWMQAVGIDIGIYYDERPHEFYKRGKNFDAFYIDLQTRRMAFRMSNAPNLYLSVARQSISDSDDEYAEGYGSGSGIILHSAGAGKLAVYGGIPIYYNTFGLVDSPDTLLSKFSLEFTMNEDDFLRMHPNASDVLF